MIIYPDKPWVDGQSFIHTTQDDVQLRGVYDQPSNTWIFKRYTDNDLVYTNTVYTVDVRPADQRVPRKPGGARGQADQRSVGEGGILRFRRVTRDSVFG